MTADIVEALANIEQPITWSTEGLDDVCFFCGAWPQYLNGERFAEHDPSCLWVRARQAVGLDLGIHSIKPVDL